MSVNRKIAIVSTAIFSMIANAFAYFNLMPHHDAINHALYFAGNWELSLGRFLLIPYGKIFGNIYMPWLNGWLSIVFLTVSVCLICEIYNMNKKWQIVLTAGFLTTNYAITELCGTFSFVLGSYSLAFMLACLGCYWVEYSSKRKLCLASVCFFLSMGLYQAYITAAMSVLLGKAVLKLLDGKKIKGVFKDCFKWGMILFIAATLYIVVYKMILHLVGIVSPDSYNSISGIKKINLLFLYHGGRVALKQFVDVFFSGKYFGIITASMNVLLLGMALWNMIKTTAKRKINKLETALCYVLIFWVFPIISQLMCVFMGLSKVYFTPSYAMFIFYPICIAIVGNYNSDERNVMQKLAMLAGGGLLCYFVLYSNGAYSLQKIAYDRTVSIVTRVAGEIDGIEGYIPGETNVILVGCMSDNKGNVELLNGIKKYEVLAGFTKTSITYPQTFTSFFKLMGDKINVESNSEKIKEYLENSVVKNMSSYPKKGYCKMIDDVLVIKFSDVS